MSVLPHSVEKVINEFSKLPGVGPKSAARMTYHYLRSPNKDASKLGEALIQMDENTKFCSKCFNVTDLEICNICSSSLRDSSKICIVEEPLDVVAFENSGVFNGVYFVLGGVISPADGIGASELRFDELQKRIKELMEESE
ncbi:MAG: recombination protein RecR, recombination protein RecR, partial [candidate division WS6 bacterium GW2011_WS6_33_547]